MRLDKFLKLSRLIKRRTIANKICTAEKVMLNGKIAKPSADVNLNDIIKLNLGKKEIKIKVLKILNLTTKENAAQMYEIIWYKKNFLHRFAINRISIF